MTRESTYKIGQQVLVRPDFTDIDCYGNGYVDDMEEYRGQIVTIKSHIICDDYEGYRLVEDSQFWAWNAKQLTPIIIDEDEAIKQLIEGHITSSTYEQMMKGRE